MKVLFLIATFLPFILTVQAQRSFTQYTCSVSHKHSEQAFYITPDETKDIEVGGWRIKAGMKRVDNAMEVSLARKVVVMDANYHREAKKNYPLNSRALPVELVHSFGGRTDVFTMICYPRDP